MLDADPDVPSCAEPLPVEVFANPFISSSMVTRRANAGAHETLGMIVERVLPFTPRTKWGDIKVYIDGKQIPMEIWLWARPKPGKKVLVRYVPRGKGLRIILQIVIVIAAIAIGNFFGGTLALSALGVGLGLSTATAAGLITAAVGFIGNALLNALIPLQSGLDKDQPSATYTIQGFRNIQAPNGVVPSVLGEHQVAPPWIVPPYSEIIDDDQWVRGVLCLGFGPVECPPEFRRIADTPFSRFPFLETEFLAGYPNDPELTLVRSTVIEKPIGVELRHYNETEAELEEGQTQTDALPTSRFTEPDITGYSFDVNFFKGLCDFDKKGKAGTQAVTLRFRERRVTVLGDAEPWVTVEAAYTFQEKMKEPFTRTYERIVPVRGQYEVEWYRVSLDPTDNDPSATKINVLRSLRPEYPIFMPPGIAYLAFKLKATSQLEGNIDLINMKIRRLIPDYDAGTGTWIERPTRNCASAFRHVLRGPENRRPRTDTDEANLIDFHDHCVTNGLKYDRVHDFESNTAAVLADVAHAGRATPRDDGSLWGVVIDRAQTVPRAALTPRNTWGFEGTRSFKRLPDEFRIKFKDATNFCADAQRSVPRPGFVGDPVVSEELEPPGVTDPDQVYLYGIYRWLEILNRPDKWTVSQSLETLFLNRGDLAPLSHQCLVKHHRSGKVVAVMGATLLLDDKVVMEAGKSYVIKFLKTAQQSDVYANGVISMTWPVITVPGETDAIHLVGEGDAPKAGELYMFGEAMSETLPVIVQNIEPIEKFGGRITVVPAGDGIWTGLAAAALAIPVWSGRVGTILDATMQAPAAPVIAIVLSDESVYSQTETVSDTPRRIAVKVRSGGGGVSPKTYVIEHKLTSSSTWIPLAPISATARQAIINIYNLGDLVQFRAKAFAADGTPSAYSAVRSHVVGQMPVGSVSITSLSVVPQSDDTFLYNFTTSRRDAEVQIRVGPSSVINFYGLTPIHTAAITSSPYPSRLPSGVGSWRVGVAAYDPTGDLGPPSYVVVTIAPAPAALTPTASTVTLNTASSTVTAIAKSGLNDANIRQLRARRFAPGVTPSAGTIVTPDQVTTANEPKTWIDSPGAGIFGYAFTALNKDSAESPYLTHPTYVAILGGTVSDDFNRADGAVGGAWTVGGTGTASLTVSGNKAAVTTGTDRLYTLTTLGSNRHYAEAKLQQTTDFGFIIVLRAADPSNFLGVRVSGGKYQVFRNVAGTLTQIGSDVTASHVVGDKVALAVNAANNVYLLLNDALILSGALGTAALDTNLKVGTLAQAALGSFDDYRAGTI